MDASEALVGRDIELAGISTFLDEAADSCAGLLIAGEPGIGKTTVWSACVRMARERSFRVLSTRPAESDRQLPLSGLDDIFRDVLPDVAADLPRPLRRAMDVAILKEEVDGEAPNLRSISAACRETLRSAAKAGPVLIAVDDLQWLDEPSLAALTYAVRRIDGDRVGLVAALRSTAEADLDEVGLFAWPLLSRLDLSPLTSGAIHRLIVDRFGRALSRPVLLRVHETSGGNPFFALEIARAFLAAGATPSDHEPPVPEELHELLRKRLDALPAEAWEVLPVIALLGNRSIAVIERLVDNAAAGLEAALEADVLNVEGDGVRFTHPLLASAVAARLLPGSARSLHRRIAAEVTDAVERARHLALSADGPDASVAAALDRAAATAATRGIPGTAADLAELAMDLTPTADTDGKTTRALQVASYAFQCGDAERSRMIAHDLLQVSDPSVRAEALLLLSDVEPDSDRAVRFAAEAIDAFSGDRRGSIHAVLQLGYCQLQKADLRAVGAAARRAQELAEEEPDPVLLVTALALVCLVNAASGKVDQELLGRAVILEESTPGIQGYANPKFALAWTLLCRDQLDEARILLQDLIDSAAECGDEIARGTVLLHLTDLECRAGEWSVATDLTEEGIALAEQIGFPFGSVLYRRALIKAYLGSVDGARVDANVGLKLSEEIGDDFYRAMNAAVLGFIELSLGNDDLAAGYLVPVADRMDELGWHDPSTIGVLPNAIEALAGIGDIDDAHRLLRRLERRGREAKSGWAKACAGRCKGILLAAEGDHAAAIEALERAVVVHRGVPIPFEQARTRLVEGVCLRRAKQKAAARSSIGDALESFQKLGARLWADRAEAELHRISGRAPSSRELTPTEQDVASLVAAGLSNRDVAARLFVSVRTVEGHLSAIYRKLGIRSRTALARELNASIDSDASSTSPAPPATA